MIRVRNGEKARGERKVLWQMTWPDRLLKTAASMSVSYRVAPNQKPLRIGGEV